MVLSSLYAIVKPAGIKKIKKDGKTVGKQMYAVIPETCLCIRCDNRNQREFIGMSYEGNWKEIDPNIPGNESYACVVCGYPITEREEGG